MIPAAQYPLLDLGSIGIQYAEVLARPANPLVRPSLNFTPFQQLGDCDSFNYSLTTTWAKRYAKNRRVSTQTKNVPVRVDSMVNVKAVQITDFVRLYSLLAEQIVVTQASGNGSYNIPAMDVNGKGGVADGIWYVGHYNISNLQYTGSGSAVIVDSAAGGVLITGSTLGAAASMTFAMGAHTGVKSKTGRVLGSALEFMVRGVSDSGEKGVLRILNVPIGPKGDIAFVPANDEFQTMELEGAALSAVDDEGDDSQGWWEPMDA